MTAPALLICERTGRWAATLRGAAGHGVALVEVRSWAACREAFAAGSAALAALEATPASAEAVAHLLTWAARFPRLQVAVLLSPEWLPDCAAAEALFREAGACDVLSSIAQVSRLEQLAACQQRRWPQPPQNLREWINSRLPFAAHAQPTG